MKKLLIFLVLSLAANVALFFAFNSRGGFASPSGPASSPAADAKPAIVPDASSPGLSPADAAALKRSGELILTGDLRVLVARLRAAGFSPSVIRGIITAQVADQFGARRKAAVAHQEVVPYWKNPQSFPYDPKTGIEVARLGREQTQLLRELLGPDSTPSDEWSRLLAQRKYGGLAQEKIDRLQDITADYNDLRSQFSAEAQGVFLPEDRAKFELLAKEQRADLVALFTPAELEEYDLRNSNTANRLRYQLTTFNASEEEYRTIFRLTQAFDAQNGNPEFGPMGDVTRDRAAAKKQLDADIAAALGPARAADYLQAINPSYQAVSRLLTRFDLPASLAPRVISVQQDIEQRANAIRQNQALSADDRTKQLSFLAQEAKTQLTTTLGPQVYEAYKSSTGGWLNNLTPPVPPKK